MDQKSWSIPVVQEMFKGLRPVLVGFVVTMHEGACKTGSQIAGFDVLFAQAQVHCDNKPRQIGLNHNYNMTFSISPHEFYYLHVKAHMCSKWEPFHVLLPLLCHVVPLNDVNCCLTIPVVKGHCALKVLPHAFNIGMFKYGKSNSTTIKHIYNESENLNESCDVAFDSNNWWNLP